MLDVAPLENMEEDHNLLFLVPKEEFNEDFSFFFWDFEFFFFGRNLKFWLMVFFKSNQRSTSPMPQIPRLFENSLFSLSLSLSLSLKIWKYFFLFLKKNWKSFFFFENSIFFFFFLEIWRFVHYQKVKKMKIKMK